MLPGRRQTLAQARLSVTRSRGLCLPRTPSPAVLARPNVGAYLPLSVFRFQLYFAVIQKKACICILLLLEFLVVYSTVCNYLLSLEASVSGSWVCYQLHFVDVLPSVFSYFTDDNFLNLYLTVGPGYCNELFYLDAIVFGCLLLCTVMLLSLFLFRCSIYSIATVYGKREVNKNFS